MALHGSLTNFSKVRVLVVEDSTNTLVILAHDLVLIEALTDHVHDNFGLSV